MQKLLSRQEGFGSETKGANEVSVESAIEASSSTMQTRGAADGLTLYASNRRTVALRGSPMLLDFGS
jgi:hypothetical protein